MRYFKNASIKSKKNTKEKDKTEINMFNFKKLDSEKKNRKKDYLIFMILL